MRVFKPHKGMFFTHLRYNFKQSWLTPEIWVKSSNNFARIEKSFFATTALIATAGVAAANPTFSGYARTGVQYDKTAGGVTSTDLTSRLRIQIDASATANNGMETGARVRIQQDEGTTGTGINHARFYVKSGNVQVGLGNIFGALESMPGMYPIDLGLTGLGYDYTAYQFNGDGYSSGGAGAGGANGVEVMYSMGGLGMHISSSDTNNRTAVHFSYAMNGWTFAVGAQNSNAAGDTDSVVSAGGTVGGANVTLAHADNGTNGKQTVLAARFDVGASTNVETYYADNSINGDGYGIDFNHDLGGGVSVRGGVAERIGGAQRADLGVRFNF
jgi:outer membrane protein OmpU